MKNYRDYEKQFIGDSDIASLTMRSPEGADVLNFGIDASYEAYIVDGDTEIGSHYKLVYECEGWLKIYDDMGFFVKFNGKSIKVYRAGEIGCIIQVID